MIAESPVGHTQELGRSLLVTIGLSQRLLHEQPPDVFEVLVDIEPFLAWLEAAKAAKIQEFLATIPKYPFQEGSSLSASGINYRSLKAMKLLDELQKSGFPVSR